MSLAVEFWCRLHNRIERAVQNPEHFDYDERGEPCRSYEDVARSIRSRYPRRSDRPCLWARIKMFFGIEVTP